MKFKKNFLVPLLLILIIIFIFNLIKKEEASINILINEEDMIIKSKYIYNHPEAVVFPAVVRSSGKKPEETEYKGIEINLLFSSLGIDIAKMKNITFNATDGYRIILPLEEIMMPRNVYLTFERDGEYLKSKKQGGNGPFQLVIRKDSFSQRWIKHVDEIILE